jgi:acyl dehydratase
VIQFQADQDAPEAPEDGALRRWLVGADAAEPTEAGPIVQRFGSILALLEADIDEVKRVIGDVLPLHTDRRSGTEIALADGALN